MFPGQHILAFEISLTISFFIRDLMTLSIKKCTLREAILFQNRQIQL